MRPATEESIRRVERVRVGEGDGRNEAITRRRHRPGREGIGARCSVVSDDRSAARPGDHVLGVPRVDGYSTYLSGELAKGAGWLPLCALIVAAPEAPAANPEAGEGAAIDDVGGDEEKKVVQSAASERPRGARVERAPRRCRMRLRVKGPWVVGVRGPPAPIAAQ